jgi:hypothetical protein
MTAFYPDWVTTPIGFGPDARHRGRSGRLGGTTGNMEVMPDGDDLDQDVVAWFEARGFQLRISDNDYSAQVRASPTGWMALSRDHHVWVDLLASDGRMLQGGYGSGISASAAMRRARQRYIEEQGG